MIDAIVARADGIPLYLEELTRTIVEPGMERRVEEIPATLADSLMARLDRLSAAKEVAQRASVLGREFSYPLLAAVVGLEEAALRHGLARLDEAEILFVRGEPPQATYTFKHALVQEAAYESLLKRTRRQLHSHVVDVILAQFPERAAAEPELVARHAERRGGSTKRSRTCNAPANKRRRARRMVRPSCSFLRRLHCSRHSPKARNGTPAKLRSSFFSEGPLPPSEVLRTPKLRLRTSERGFCARP